MPPKKQSLAAGHKIVASNRKARHDFDVLESVECGIVLVGAEVKSLRAGGVQLRDSYARVEGTACWLHGVHVAPYVHAHGVGRPDPDRSRKLLLHGQEIERLGARVAQDGLTLVPLSVYFNEEGRAKVELALCRGRKTYDKRHAIADRDAKRETERSARVSARGE
jgi:SsrA-binding protein